MDNVYALERKNHNPRSRQNAPVRYDKDMLAMSEKQDVPFLRRMDIVRNYLDKELNEINKQKLHEYTRISELNNIQSTASTVMNDFKDHMGELTEGLNLLRKAFTSINQTLERKFKNEKIDFTTIEITTSENAEWVIKISEAKIALSQARKRFSEFEELAAQMEEETAEAAKEASDFIAEAEASKRHFEQLEELERNRRKEEEARQKQEEENRRKREQEEKERKKKEEEDRRKAQEAEEIKRKEEERIRIEKEAREKHEKEEAEKQRIAEELKRKKKEEEAERKQKAEEKMRIEKEQREKREKEEAEKLRIAEEAKRKQEEEERERKRKEDEEIKTKKREELRKREQEVRRRRQEEDRKRKEIKEEERRLEMERRDPNNWENWQYSVKVEEGEISIGCVIKAMANTANRDDFSVKCVSQLSSSLNLNTNECLVSHIIKISHVDDDFVAPIPLSISFPHKAPRNATLDTVIKMKLESGWWREIPTSDILFDEMKEYKFVECRAERISSFAVVTRPKIEKYTVPREGANLTSGVDGRVSIDIKANFFKVSSQVELEVQPVDSNTVSDLHSRYPECSGLITASPMVKFTTPLKGPYSKNVMFNIPLPSPYNKKARPKSAMERPTESLELRKRPMTAALRATGRSGDKEDEGLLILTQSQSGCWTTLDDVPLKKNKHKEIVMFELDKPIERFIIVRSKDDIQQSRTEKNVSTLEETLYDRHVQLVLRQRLNDPYDLLLWAAPILKTEAIIHRLKEKGFAIGPQPSADIIMREGDEIHIRFKGNIEPENGSEMKMVFNSNINSKLHFRVDVKDRFYQKAQSKYYGFVQGLTFEKVPDRTSEEATKEGNPKMVTKLLPAAEFLVQLPKADTREPMPIVNRTAVKVKPEGLVNEDLLHQISSELGDEWKKMASFLGVKSSRLQAIERNNVNSTTNSMAFEMLITWIKSEPKSADKVGKLIDALSGCGRKDLARLMHEKDMEFKQEAALSARGDHLRKAFICISKSPALVKNWTALANSLNIEEATIEEIKKGSDNARNQCNQMLLYWQESEESATLLRLVKALRKCGHSTVADRIADLMKEVR